MKKILLASALLVPLALVGLKMMQPAPHYVDTYTHNWLGHDTYTIYGTLGTLNGTVADLPYGPVRGGTVNDRPPACIIVGHYQEANTWITFTATPSKGWVFTGWVNTPGCRGTGPCREWLSNAGGVGFTASFRRRSWSWWP